jgi:hypothetical protein
MDDYTPSENSKTVFYVPTPFSRIKRFAWIVLVAALVLGGIIVWANIGAGARSALSHAKDVRVAMKLISLEYYGGDGSIYNPTNQNGLANDAITRMKAVIPIEGEIILTGWDYENNIPLSFSYRENKYLVEYREVGVGDGSYGMNGDWIVYVDFKVLEYSVKD